MGHGSFGDLNTSITKSLMDFRNTSMCGVTERPDQCNHIQAKLAMG
jgi:hypothetical protein